jgi:TPR repeat protein
MRISIIFILLIKLYLPSLAAEESLSQPSRFIALFRGIHFFKEIFEEKDIDRHLRDSTLIAGQPLFSSAAGTLVSESYLTADPQKHLLLQSGLVNKDILTEFKEYHERYYDIVHQTFTNNHYRFHYLLGDTTYINERGASTNITPLERAAFEVYKEIFLEEIKNPSRKLTSVNEEAVWRNCFISFSQEPKHALKYAFGQKYMVGTFLKPDYNNKGVPKNKYLGKIYIALLKEEDFKRENPTSVLDLHAQGKIDIEVNQRNILCEKEVSFLGYVKGDYIFHSQVIEVPSFKGQYDKAYKNKYGLTQNQYNKFKGLGSNLNEGSNFTRLLENHLIPAISQELWRIAEQETTDIGGELTYVGLGQEINRVLPWQLSNHLHKVYKNWPIFINTTDSLTRLGKATQDSGDIVSSVSLIFKAVPFSQVNLIDIRDYKLTGAGAIFPTLLKQSNTLTELILNNLNLNAKDTKKIAQALKGNKYLTYLSLQDNPIEDEGNQFLCEALKENQTLRRLNILGTRITIEGIEYYSKILVIKNKKQLNKGLTELLYAEMEGENFKKLSISIRSGLRRNISGLYQKREILSSYSKPHSSLDLMELEENTSDNHCAPDSDLTALSLQHGQPVAEYILGMRHLTEPRGLEDNFRLAAQHLIKSTVFGHHKAPFKTLCLLIENKDHRTKRLQIKGYIYEFLKDIEPGISFKNLLLLILERIKYKEYKVFDQGKNLYFRGKKSPSAQEDPHQVYSQAWWYFYCAASNNHVEAQYIIGKMYEKGRGVCQDFNKSIKWMERAAINGSNKAEYRMGRIYEEGREVCQDFNKAIKWMEKAATHGSRKALDRLWRMIYEEGKILEQSHKWIKEAARKGIIEAQYMVGDWYKKHRQNYKEALYWFKIAAEEHSYLSSRPERNKCIVKAHYQIGKMHKKGWKSNDPDLLEAGTYFLEAAKRGHSKAQYKLGKIYEFLDSFLLPYDEKVQILYAKATEDGIYDENFEFEMGKIYEYGHEDIKPDLEEACYWYQEAEKHRHRGASAKLLSFDLGADTQRFYEPSSKFNRIKKFFHREIKDRKTAFYWYLKSANQGHVKAQFKLGSLYEHGNGVEVDLSKAFEWYLKAANQGYTIAEYNVAVMYKNGQGIAPSPVDSVQWYRKAAQKGDIDAQYDLGKTYESGLGVKKSLIQAAMWYRRAAAQNHEKASNKLDMLHKNGDLAKAQYELGRKYEDGLKITQDDKKAAKWYRKAAKQNHREACYRLGMLYENGHGVAQNYKEAEKWYSKAAEQGHEDAHHGLVRIYAYNQDNELEGSEFENVRFSNWEEMEIE